MDTNFWRVQWQHAGERQETAQLLHLTEELIRHERLPRGKKDHLEVPPICIQYQHKDSERSPGREAIHNPGRVSPITRFNPRFSLVQCFSIHTSAFTFYFNCTVVVKFQLSAKHQCSSQRWCQDKSRETRRRSQLLFGTCWSRNRDHLDGNTKGNGSGTWNVLLCYNLKSDISSSQQRLFIKRYKQLNPMGSTHVHPHHLLLKHILILCWHKQYLKRI